MNSKQTHEISFWRNLVRAEGDNFKNRRKGDLERRMMYLDMDLSGKGLEIGTGCFSMFEFSKAKNVVSIDPLNDEYAKLIDLSSKKIEYITADGELLPFEDDTFNWVALFNVIDHTPTPRQMAAEIFRVLKPGGFLYFDVNFDDELSPCHYSLWTEETVKDIMKDFKLIHEVSVRNDADRQWNYYATFTV